MTDPDAPIPYTITAKGRLDLQIALLEEKLPKCKHDWRYEAGDLVCLLCGDEKGLKRPDSIPGYLGPKDW